ncbi:MAG TPA: hypothetical protein VK718_05990 [Ferruginibacter sp.]|jgi:hypothetical protein|nr:hypothetical protein [Ferruginibacter sp.]
MTTNWLQKIAYQRFFIKLFNWEYWPFNLVYIPVYIYWIWLFIRSRSLFYFNAANPSIKNGGFLMEPKKDIYDILPKGSYPNTLLFKKDSTHNILSTIKENGFVYPLIGKPNIGMQGLAVKKLETETDVIAYANAALVDFLIQEFVPYENEVGIFYYRYPGETKGHISGIVEKEFLSVTGNGTATIKELLQKDTRFILQLPYLQSANPNLMQKVLVEGEIQILVPYGNHARGAKFIDISHLITDELETSIDKFCRQINGFYFGRMDVRYNTWKELERGEKFSIIELNGAGSEPTHIYDPGHSIFFAWKEVIRHLNILCKISRINHAKNGTPYMTFSEGMTMLKENKAYVKLIREQHNQHSTLQTVA